ncbi:MAG TPA: DUF58 domain-containing protein [Solirubrobacterales bacterium]|nr:DUF58 domain-containing protein [Solirubrobacterales bacterium]
MAPTPKVALFLALAGLSAFVVPPVFALIGALAILGAAGADAFLVRGSPRIQREAPEILSRGIPEALVVDATSRFAGTIRVRQPAPPDLDLAEAESDAPLRSQLVARRRGRHVLPAAAARTEGPLRLGAWYHRGGGEAEVRVYPDLPAARRIATSVRRSRFRDQGLRGRGPLGLGTEFERVRDYSPDDDIRQVNWLATARMDRPMSNDYRVEQDRDLIAVLDAGRLMASPIGDATRLDVAMDAFCSLAAVADEVGDRFGALVFDSEVRRYLPPARGGGALAVNTLFDIEPEAVDSDYVRAFQRVEAAKRAWVVVFTDLLEEVAARSLIEGVPVLARKHSVAVATARDPDIEAALTTAPSEPLDAYRTAVALDVSEARRRVGVRLSHAGAQLVEAEASALGAATVSAYLRAKARARL